MRGVWFPNPPGGINPPWLPPGGCQPPNPPVPMYGPKRGSVKSVFMRFMPNVINKVLVTHTWARSAHQGDGRRTGGGSEANLGPTVQKACHGVLEGGPGGEPPGR